MRGRFGSTIIFCLGFLARSGAIAAYAPVEETGTVRQQFVAAWKLVQSKQPDHLDTAALKAYVIYDYLVAARLQRDLRTAPGEELDKRIDTFVADHARQPVIRALQRDWLISLAARGRWDWFLPRSANLNDGAVICGRLAARLATNDTAGLSADGLARWRLPQQQPPECDPVFAWLRQQDLLTPDLAEERTRAALAADNWRLARDFITDVPAPRNAALLQWIKLLQSPRPELSALGGDPALGVEPRALLAGFTRLSISDFAAASNLLPALLLRVEGTPELQGQMQRAFALGAAYSRSAEAVAAFDKVPATMIDATVQEWRARAALWAGNFSKARVWIEQMPPDLAGQPRWRYWRARALAESAGMDAAAPLFAELAEVRDYYGYLAADRLERKYRLNERSLPVDAAMQTRLSADEGLVRAHALFDARLNDEAIVEWAVALANADPAVRIQAAILASHWGWYAQSIALQASLGEWDDLILRYPRPYRAAVGAASGRTRVPGDWIYAVMRQESLYRNDALSPAGARGLMQVLPSTAAALAKRWHLAPLPADALFDPAIATLLGAAHLRELLDRYSEALPLSLAAYNAGAVPMARWLPDRTMDADIWIENIPYSETRSYVQRILEHIVAFAWVRKARLPRLAAMMPPVQAAAR